MALTLTAAVANAACNAMTALMDGGSVQFQESDDSVVATCALETKAFGAASDGVATANTITADSTAVGGTVDHAHIMSSDGTTSLLTATCTVTGGGGDFEWSSLNVGAGDTVTINSLEYAMPLS